MTFPVGTKVHRQMICRLMLCVALVTMSLQAKAVDYYSVTITGIGQDSSGDYLRFTIDQDPYVILTTQGMSGEVLKRMTALIITAYSTQAPVYMVRSSDASSTTVSHYASVQFLSLGRRTWD